MNYLVHILSDNTELNFGRISISVGELEVFVNKGLKILFLVFLMFISIKIGNYIIKKFVDNQIKSDGRLSMDSQRAKTLGEVMKSVLKYSVYFIGITAMASIIFGGISITFASIGGVALGLGAQSLIKDLINGFFILFENQFGVGDYITIGNFSGIVSSIGIRTTIIKDFNGDIHCITNGSILEVTNHSRSDSSFIVDVNIAYKEDIDNAISVIEKTCEEFKKENEKDIKEPINVLGVVALGASGVTIRVLGKAKPLRQWDMERELRKLIKVTLDKNNIEIPFPTNMINTNF
ncbi:MULTISPECIES: mechanosensitive ion channel family protein [Clostridium]|uniref:mechanosensitive ion channel family protein n=1 Tax=Clostridium sp. TaxID=1506 RepID=UPI00071D712D|nr:MULTISPECIES: mechanosensitive ion channel family protein [Clostridium]MDU4478134.1 mechanosensitive ion channel family protein [Clostridium sp.]MDU4848389.1 mechanosensitive ion channel family protein [Clostridium sp.]